MIRLYLHPDGQLLADDGDGLRALPGLEIDDLFGAERADALLRQHLDSEESGAFILDGDPADVPWRPPVGRQEIWAAGVTYQRSRAARMDESEAAGADRFYDLVYDAERPELFLKATAPRARGHLAPVRVRRDSTWDVPEPELTLAVNARGEIFGYTLGNDLSSRDIEGQNPLYLPQAKVYRGACSIGPALVVAPPPPPTTEIRMEVQRAGETAFSGSVRLHQIKRGFDELTYHLFNENEFPHGCLLMTGTGIVPPREFTLLSGDLVRISSDPVGTLENRVE